MSGEIVAPDVQSYNASNVTRASITFDAGVGSGAVATGYVNLFSITGKVLVRAIMPYCVTDLTGAAATLALGVTGNTGGFVAATVGTTIDADEFWVTTTPTANLIALPAACKDIMVGASADPTPGIFLTIAVADVTGGNLAVTVFWDAITSGAKITSSINT